MLVLWLFTMLLTVSPALHHYFHPDSDECTHQCLITAFQKSSFEGVNCDVILVTSNYYIICVPSVLPDSFHPPLFDFSLLSSRGPPTVLFS